mgnify:CR=1 FL=1
MGVHYIGQVEHEGAMLRRVFDAAEGGTRFHGLVESWLGYGLLSPDGSFTAVKNVATIPPEPSLLGRLASRLGFTREPALP